MQGMDEAIACQDRKQAIVNRIFKIVAPRYDFITVALSYGMDRGWKRQLIEMAKIQSHDTILDLACGTGDLTFQAVVQAPQGLVLGLDICLDMLLLAQLRKHSPPPPVSFLCADIIQLPFPDNSFDLITAGYALRNVSDLRTALTAIYRSLKPGGRFLSLDFGKPANRHYCRFYLRYLALAGSFWGWLLHRDADVYRYIAISLKHYPAQTGVKLLMDQLGFVDTGFQEFLGGAMAINFGSKPAAGSP
ncbi:MAG: ubiquinone/menaquinone biosynthesis methyltransferase [Acidobacteriota bacterium]